MVSVHVPRRLHCVLTGTGRGSGIDGLPDPVGTDVLVIYPFRAMKVDHDVRVGRFDDVPNRPCERRRWRLPGRELSVEVPVVVVVGIAFDGDLVRPRNRDEFSTVYRPRFDTVRSSIPGRFVPLNAADDDGSRSTLSVSVTYTSVSSGVPSRIVYVVRSAALLVPCMASTAGIPAATKPVRRINERRVRSDSAVSAVTCSFITSCITDKFDLVIIRHPFRKDRIAANRFGMSPYVATKRIRVTDIRYLDRRPVERPNSSKKRTDGSGRITCIHPQILFFLSDIIPPTNLHSTHAAPIDGTNRRSSTTSPRETTYWWPIGRRSGCLWSSRTSVGALAASRNIPPESAVSKHCGSKETELNPAELLGERFRIDR